MAKDEPSNETILAESPTPWDGFVTGPENALAQASVLALAWGGDAAVGLSPLVVHGPSGVGKSRLLAALVAECVLRRPGSAVAHLEAEAFAAACAEAAGPTCASGSASSTCSCSRICTRWSGPRSP